MEPSGTGVTYQQLEDIAKSCTEAIELEADSYGLEVEDRIYHKILRIFKATSLDEAVELAKKARAAHQIHCLFKKGVSDTPEKFEKQAEKAESLRKSMDAKGDKKEAAKHKARAEKYNAEAKKLRKVGE